MFHSTAYINSTRYWHNTLPHRNHFLCALPCITETSANELANFQFSPLGMGIKWFNRAALLDLPNVTGPDGPNSDIETSPFVGMLPFVLQRAAMTRNRTCQLLANWWTVQFFPTQFTVHFELNILRSYGLESYLTWLNTPLSTSQGTTRRTQPFSDAVQLCDKLFRSSIVMP